MDQLEKLYECAEALSGMKGAAADGEEKNYLTILEAVTSQISKEKMLASQFIARFAKLFPSMATNSMNAMFDLCEDSDVTVRKQVINDLPTFCRDFKTEIPNVTYVLLQLVKTEDNNEVASIHKALQNLIKTDSRGAFTGIFSLVKEADPATRLKIFKFLATKLKQMEAGTVAPEAETLLLSESRKLLKVLSSEEFNLLLEALKHTRIGKSVTGQQTLADLAIDFSEAIATKDSEVSAIEDAIVSLKIALPFFCSAVRSSRLLKYVGEHLLPRFNDISDAHKRDLLKTLALLTSSAGEIENPKEMMSMLFPAFVQVVPEPNPENIENKVEIDYSSCEAILYALHRLGAKATDFLTEDQERLAGFRLRLQYLSRNVVPYTKVLTDDIKKMKPDEKETAEKQTALKVLSNIQALIIDFMKNPPVYTKVVHLSFETKREAVKAPEVAKKRREPIELEGSVAKRERDNRDRGYYRQPYSVPGGKFSSQSDRHSFRGRGRGRGRY